MDETKKRYIESIIKKHAEERKRYDNDYKIANIKNWFGGLIIIGSTLIPGTALLKIFGGLAKVSPAAAKLLPLITNTIIKNIKFSKPLFRQIVVNALKKSVFESGAYGGIYGLGYSIHQDKNFKETVETIADSVVNGIILSVLLSSAALTGNLMVKGNDILYNFDRRKDWGIVFKKASGYPELAIKTLLKYQKGFVPKAIYKKGIGNIDLVWGKTGRKGYGLAHINEKRTKESIDAIKFINQIPNIFKNAKIINDLKQKNVKLLKYLDNNIVVKLVWNNKKRKWVVTSFKDISKSAETNRTPDIVSNYSEMTPSQTTDMKNFINNFDKSAAKRLAAWKPKSKPYVDSRILFTTELNRLIDILKTKNKFVNSRLINISQKKLKKLLLFILLNQMINKRKNIKKINLGFNNLNTKSQNIHNFNSEQTVNSFKPFKQNTFTPLKYNYGKNKTVYNTMPIQNEKNPTLYKGTAIKPQALSTSGGRSVLNTAANNPIPQFKFKNLPEFKPLNVALNTNSFYNLDNVSDYITGNDAFLNASGGNIDMSSVVYLSMLLLDMYQSKDDWRPTVRKGGNVNTSDTNDSEQNSDTQQQTQGYEFIPFEY